MKRCRNCFLPENFPQGSINQNGLCSSCHDSVSLINSSFKNTAHKDFIKTIKQTRQLDIPYHCMVGLSGGKDSAYLSYLLAEKFKLRVLAVTFETGFLSQLALKNIKKTIHTLKLSHQFIEEKAFFNKLYRYCFQNLSEENCLSSICRPCGFIVNILLLKKAWRERIPLVFLGFTLGQPGINKQLHTYEVPQKIVQKGMFVNELLPLSKKFPSDLKTNIKSFCCLKGLDPKKTPRVIFPFHILDYHQDKIIQKTEQLGLLDKRSQNPLMTNCLMNLPLAYLQITKTCYSPFAGHLSTLIRHHQANAPHWLKLEDSVIRQLDTGHYTKEIDQTLKTLGLTRHQILENWWRHYPNTKHIGFEITNRCNLACQICSIWKTKKKQDLSIKDISRIICFFNHPLTISLTGGEALLHPAFNKIYTYLFNLYTKKKIQAITLSSNGTYLKIANFLKTNKNKLSCLSFSMSLDGLKEKHNLQRGSTTAFQEALQSILLIRKNNIPLTLKFTLTRLNYQDLAKVYYLAKKLNCGFKITFFEHNIHNYYHRYSHTPKDLSLTALQKNEVRQIIKEISQKEQQNSPDKKILQTLLHGQWFLGGSGHDSIRKFLIESNTLDSLFVTTERTILNNIYSPAIGFMDKESIHIDWEELGRIKRRALTSNDIHLLSPYSYLRQI